MQRKKNRTYILRIRFAMKTKQLVITFHCYMGYFSDIKMLQELKIILSTMSPHLMRKTSIKCPQQD